MTSEDEQRAFEKKVEAAGKIKTAGLSLLTEERNHVADLNELKKKKKLEEEEKEKEKEVGTPQKKPSRFPTKKNAGGGG